MHRLTAGRRFLTLLLAAMLLHAALLAAVAAISGVEAAMTEDGPLEQSQNLILLAASALFFLAAWRWRGGPRMAAFDAGVLCVIFFFRELELPPQGPVTTYLKSRAFRWHEAIALVAVLTPYAVFRWRLVLDLIIYVVTLRAWPFLIAAGLLLTSAVFDKFGGGLIGYPHSVFMEELAESTAYLVLLLIGCLFLKRTGQDSEAVRAAHDRDRARRISSDQV